MPDPAMLDLLQRLAVALGLGFLLGIERGWRHRDAAEGTRAAGLRTHALIGLMGGLTGALLPAVGPVGFAALSLAFAGAFVTFKFRETLVDNDLSVTGTIAGLIVFALGAYAVLGNLAVSAAAGVTLVSMMALKPALHAWLDKLTWPELRSALLILAATFIALPLLPDRTVDPWGLLNPRELWLLTILVAGASFAGYVGVRVFGGELGVLAGAAAGALVSSTVVTAELGRRVRSGETHAVIASAGAAAAACVSVLRVGALLAIASPIVAASAAPALAGAFAAFAVAAFGMRRLDPQIARGGGAGGLHSPLDLASVGQFALLLGGVIAIGRLITQSYGQAGLLPFAAAAGIADVDPVALAVGPLARGGVAPAIAAEAVMLALLVNTASKAVIAFVTGGRRFGAFYAGAALAAAIVGAAVWYVAKA